MASAWWGAESGGNSTRLSVQELLSACGGDLCSALPWLALLSADFSYNALTALDSSLVSEPQEGLGKLGNHSDGPLGWRASWLPGDVRFSASCPYPPSASLVSSSLLEPEPQSSPGLQGLPDGEYEQPGWAGATWASTCAAQTFSCRLFLLPPCSCLSSATPLLPHPYSSWSRILGGSTLWRHRLWHKTNQCSNLNS